MSDKYGGIDLGGTKIQAAVVDDDGTVLGQARNPTPRDHGPSGVVEAMAATMEEAATGADVKTSKLAGVGVGSPGVVDGDKGTVSGAGNLPDWGGSVAVRDQLGEAFGTTVLLGNDVQVATDAEVQLGAARRYDALLGVFWGTGVGGGIVLDGKPWIGRAAAGEIGHMVIDVDGRQCPCGRKGCMEAYAGRGAMETEARRRVDAGQETVLFDIMEERGKDRLSSGVWSRALDAEDELAAALIDEAVRALGAGVASAVNLLDVGAVVIGGGMGLRMGELYVVKIAQAMQPHLFNDGTPPDVLLAALGDLGGAIGASLLVKNA